MKTKLLKRLRQQAESEVRIPCDMFNWILDIYYFNIDKFYNGAITFFTEWRICDAGALAGPLY